MYSFVSFVEFIIVYIKIVDKNILIQPFFYTKNNILIEDYHSVG